MGSFDAMMDRVAHEAGMAEVPLGSRVRELLQQEWAQAGGYANYKALWDDLQDRVVKTEASQRELREEARARISDEVAAIWGRIDTLAAKLEEHGSPAFWDAVLQAKREGLSPASPDTSGGAAIWESTDVCGFCGFRLCDHARNGEGVLCHPEPTGPDAPEAPSGSHLCFWKLCAQPRMESKPYCLKHASTYEDSQQASHAKEAYREALAGLLRAVNDSNGDRLTAACVHARKVLGPGSFCGICGKLFGENTVTKIDPARGRVHVQGSPDCRVGF
jgi:hypothetical protein